MQIADYAFKKLLDIYLKKYNMQIDFIGDIHGHADELKQLLNKLGYTINNNVYTHPTKKVVFLGDYIDRGPKIVETLAIVKSMVDAGQAIALMGNHEYNALCFATKNSTGGYLREHNIKNIAQHYETLRQFKNNQCLYDEYIEWFKTLPLYLDTDDFIAVHACWDSLSIDYLKNNLKNGCLNDELLHKSIIEGSKLFESVENVLKGKELSLPDDLHFYDKDGNIRNQIRIKWWLNPTDLTYKKISVLQIDNLPDVVVANGMNFSYYNDDKPVFFGHYWLTGTPKLIAHNVCCLDYSVAKGGTLAAYSFNGERLLNSENLISV